MTDALFILPLAQCADVAIAGGKAVNLGVLLRAGFPVPDGFAITTEAFRVGRALPAGESVDLGTAHGGPQAPADNDPPGGQCPPYDARDDNVAVVRDAILAAYRHLGAGAVAVRSSATAEDMAGASMAGQYDTFLHVTSEAELLDAVERCWQSLRSDRTRSYLAGHGIDVDSVAMAVVVQRLVRADVAGVLFTANPRTGDRGEMLAEATWGLGETLVSGRVQPDVYRIDRAGGRIVDQRTGDKARMIPPGGHEIDTPPHLRRMPCLRAEDVTALWQLGRRAAEHFGAEQDIEFAIQAGRLYLLQSRPITTLDDADAYEQVLREARQQLRSSRITPVSERTREGPDAADETLRPGSGSSRIRSDTGVRSTEAPPRGPWVRHNLGETLPHPTPLTWSVLRPFMSGAGGFGALYRTAGFEPSADVCRDGFLELIAGRIYMDASRAAGMFFDRYPARYDVELLRRNPDAAQSPPTIPAGSLLSRWRVNRRIATVHRNLAAIAVDLDRKLRQEIFPKFAGYCTAERARDLAAMTGDELVACWNARRAAVLDDFAPQSLLPSLVEGMALAELRQFLAEEVWEEDAGELAAAVSSGPTPNLTLLADAGLYDIAAGRRTVDDWLRQFGHRAAGEFDLATPRWREQPDAVRAMADRLAGGASPIVLHAAHAEAIRRRVAGLSAKMSPANAKQFQQRLDVVWRYIGFREDGKYHLMLGYELLRDVAVEIGRRSGLGDDVFFLTEDEMLRVGRALPAGERAGTPATSPPRACDRRDESDEAGAKSRLGIRVGEYAHPTSSDASSGGQCPPYAIAARKRRRRAETRLSLPHVITADDIDALGAPPAVAGDGVHAAFAVSTGVATGPARIVRSPTDAGDLGKGYVLVCPSTDPNWTPLFVNAAALVLECGGTLSHGAVVAREMGLPAVVLPDATRLFADGQSLRVDGHNGSVGPDCGAGVPPAVAAGTAAPQAVGQLPPPPGAKDRRAARWALRATLLWSVFLALAFLLPEHWLYQPSLRLLDAVYWPLVPLLGKPLTVAAIAVFVAFATIALQRWLTDNRRLKEAKRRAACGFANPAAWASAKPLDTDPRDSVGETASGVARPTHSSAPHPVWAAVQRRLLGAALVPMGLLLGPMILTFFWMPARMDPANWNASPGTVVQVEAELSPGASGDVTLFAAAPLKLDPATPSAQPIEDTAPARQALVQLLTAWEGAHPPDEPIATQLDVIRTKPESPAALRRFLQSQSIAPRPVRWTLHTPPESGRWPIAIRGPDGRVLRLKAVVGDARPPEPSEILGDEGSAVVRTRLVYETRPPTRFWTPLAGVTWMNGWTQWDAGWLGVYLLAYLPAMFAARRVFGVA